MQVSQLKNTPYQRIKNSPPGRFVRENKLATGAVAVGGAIVLAGGAVQSTAVARVAEYGVIPAVGAGMAVVGFAAAHDAVVNDLGRRNGLAAAKLAAGTLSGLAGVQIVGMSYDIPVLERALTGPLEALSDHGLAVLGTGVAGGGVAAGVLAARQFKQAFGQSENRPRHAALGVAASLGSAGGLLGGTELIARQYGIAGLNRAFTGTVEHLAQSPAAAVGGGALLLAGAGVLGAEAVGNFRKGGNDLLTVAEGMGAVSAGLGGLELIGHGARVPALQGLLTHNADLVGSAALSVGGLAVGRLALKDAQGNGLGVKSSLALGAAAVMVPGGLMVGAESLGMMAAVDVLSRGTQLGLGAGLGLTTVALGKNAVQAARKGEVGSALFQGVVGAGTATGSLLVTGDALGIEAISRLGQKLADATIEPLAEHVLWPTARFLFENPVAGAAVLATGLGVYLYYKHRQSQD
ncbi:hypothetical protein DYH09_12470 [bacterium CPR1]|nr:hypothetical protein [bacterium CPR1]